MTVKIDGTNTVANPAFTGADTDTGLQCGTNELKLVTGGSARVTVDSSGNLGIGTTTPTFTAGGGVHNKGTNAFTSFRASVDANTGIDFAATTDGKGYLYNRDNADLIFGTNNTERMRILADGTIRLASGCPGIDFSQIQTNASGMTSETLDSYEEGTFDAFATVANEFTGETTNVSRYTKIGNFVHVDLRVQWTGTIGGSSGFQLNLPFAEAGTTTSSTANTGIVFYAGTSVDNSAISTHISKGSSKVAFYKTDGGSFNTVSRNDVNGTYDWCVSFSYFAG